MKKMTPQEKIDMLAKMNNDKVAVIKSLEDSNIALKELYNKTMFQIAFWKSLALRYEETIFKVKLPPGRG